MFEYYNENNEVVARQDNLRDFTVDEKYAINIETKKKTENKDYDSQAVKELKLIPIKIKRNKLLKATDWTLVEDAPFTDAAKKEIKEYRTLSRALPEKIIANDFTDLSFPKPPEFLNYILNS